VALVCGGPVSDHVYPVVQAGGTYSQYLRAPVVCATRYRGADVVIDVENGLPYFSPLWRRSPSVCLVHHVHTDQWAMQFPKAVAAVGRAIETRAMPAIYRNRTFVAVSSSTADALRMIGVRDDRIRIIENGVDIPPGPLPPKSTEPLYLSLSRVVPHKRLHLLLRAWEVAARSVPGRLVIAGDGPGLEPLRQQAATIPRTHVVGRIDEGEKMRLLSESWILLSAAHHEGWGMSVMEAAAHGTPALAIDAPGIRDAIADGATGVLVRGAEGDLVPALAQAWVDLASATERRLTMGATARAWAEKFSWDRTTDRWLELLEEVGSAAAGRRSGYAPTTGGA